MWVKSCVSNDTHDKGTQKVSNHLIKRPRSLEIKIIMCIFASMKQAIVYNLTDFAAKYQLNDIFGAYAAHLMVSDNNRRA